MQRLSSGLRINSAADDAAGLGISEKMRGQIRGLEQANRNIQDGLNAVNTAEAALSEVHSILQRARELAVMWNNGTLDFNAKLAIRQEVDGLCNEIARIAATTTFMGVPLLSGATRITLQVGANDNDTMSISLVSAFGPGVGDLVRPNTFSWLPWLNSDIPGVDLHINDVSAARARLGAFANRLEHALATNDNYLENLMSAESRIRDTDMAMEMTNLTRNQLLQATSSTMLLFANQNPQRVMGLFAT